MGMRRSAKSKAFGRSKVGFEFDFGVCVIGRDAKERK